MQLPRVFLCQDWVKTADMEPWNSTCCSGWACFCYSVLEKLDTLCFGNEAHKHKFLFGELSVQPFEKCMIMIKNTVFIHHFKKKTKFKSGYRENQVTKWLPIQKDL